jgi:hypothetical protein
MTTFAEFYSSQIETDLEWREKELAVLRKQLLHTDVGSPQEVTFLRTNLAMIYAHYEGFCKFALGIYIDALEKIGLTRAELRWVIAAQSLQAFQSELKGISDPDEFFTKLLSEFESHLNAKATYVKPENIANLWPDLLVKWLKRLGLQSTTVQSEKQRLDSLVNTRNQIAHGKKLPIANRAELEKYAEAATLAMHEVAVGVTDALEKKLYKRAGTVMTIFGHAVT